jgi:hypothetical protein
VHSPKKAEFTKKGPQLVTDCDLPATARALGDDVDVCALQDALAPAQRVRLHPCVRAFWALLLQPAMVTRRTAPLMR